MIIQLGAAVLFVILIVFFITFNAQVTILIVLSVFLVIVYMTATINFWGMNLNQLTGMNLIFALGISIDYSVHIAHKYLIINQSSNHTSK